RRPRAGRWRGRGRRRCRTRCAMLPSTAQEEAAMRDEQAIETESTELLRTLIRNGCVNTGEASSGHEARSVDALEAFFAGSGLACERYTSEPGRTSLITRLDGSDRRAPTLLL